MNFMWKDGRPVILDGATGMNLQKAGMPAGVCPEQWVIEHPDALKALQRDFVRAGSNAVYAPTFGANRVKLKKYGLDGRTAEMNRELVALSREAVGEGVAVGGDMTSLGLFIEPFGTESFDDIVEIYREQAQALSEAGVDFFIAETIMQLFEARAALLAVRSVSDKPFFVSITVEQNGRMLGGTEPLAALSVMQGMGADAFGLNCSDGPAEIAAIIESIAPYAQIPLLAKPNAGMPCVGEDGSSHYHMTPETFAAYAPRLTAAGTAYLGGCCGTEPVHSAALAAACAAQTVAPPRAAAAFAATDKAAFVFDAPPPLRPAENESASMADAIADCEADDGEVVFLRLRSEEDAVEFQENQYLLRNPICLLTNEAALLDRALFAYQGRAFVSADGSADSALAEAARKYGAILI